MNECLDIIQSKSVVISYIINFNKTKIIFKKKIFLRMLFYKNNVTFITMVEYL